MDRWALASMKQNVGLIKSCQYAYEYARANSYDILCLTHNDVWIYADQWDWHVVHQFELDPKLGGVGLFGSKGCSKDGHRLETFGSLIEMSGHGRKMANDRVGYYEPACTFDGFFMAFSMEMLKQAGGFDQRYFMHHMYDLDSSLTSIKLGYKNIVLNLPCHHLSGLTANNEARAVATQEIHQANSVLWKQKWSHELGVMVDDDFNYRWKL